MRVLLAASVAAAVLSVSHMTAAQTKGPYITGALGLSQPLDSDITGNGVNTSLDSDKGYVLSGALGNTYGENLRAETEFSFSRASVDSIGSAAAAGRTSRIGLMINGYYDFTTNSAFTPYLGFGAGFMSVSYDNVSPVGSSRIDDRDKTFAYQGIAGVNYQIDDQVSFFTDYRYVRTPGINLHSDAGARLDVDNAEHRVMVGLRWSFNAPKPAMKPEAVAPMPVAAPAPEPKPEPKPEPVVVQPEPEPQAPQRYLVFFDWDRADLTTDVKAILEQVAANSKTAELNDIEAIGHADRSGTNRYNLALSQRRAEAVRTELSRLGIPSNDIKADWKGEEEPLVQTADGVREPQNRRVEITLK